MAASSAVASAQGVESSSASLTSSLIMGFLLYHSAIARGSSRRFEPGCQLRRSVYRMGQGTYRLCLRFGLFYVFCAAIAPLVRVRARCS